LTATTPDAAGMAGDGGCSTGGGVATGGDFRAVGLGGGPVDLDGGTTGSAGGLGEDGLGPICGSAGSLGGLDG
jgi:hypothetical protein